jgi:hypothetical protein
LKLLGQVVHRTVESLFHSWCGLGLRKGRLPLYLSKSDGAARHAAMKDRMHHQRSVSYMDVHVHVSHSSTTDAVSKIGAESIIRTKKLSCDGRVNTRRQTNNDVGRRKEVTTRNHVVPRDRR